MKKVVQLKKRVDRFWNIFYGDEWLFRSQLTNQIALIDASIRFDYFCEGYLIVRLIHSPWSNWKKNHLLHSKVCISSYSIFLSFATILKWKFESNVVSFSTFVWTKINKTTTRWQKNKRTNHKKKKKKKKISQTWKSWQVPFYFIISSQLYWQSNHHCSLFFFFFWFDQITNRYRFSHQYILCWCLVTLTFSNDNVQRLLTH